MSQTLNLTCDDCKVTLWVGQQSRTRGWFVYGTEAEREALNKFVNDHIGHAVRFQDSGRVGFDVDDIAVYDDEPSSEGCRAKLAPGQHWTFCGETDMGQTEPALCERCGGSFKPA